LAKGESENDRPFSIGPFYQLTVTGCSRPARLRPPSEKCMFKVMSALSEAALVPAFHPEQFVSKKKSHVSKARDMGWS